jgi:hypothetical protein
MAKTYITGHDVKDSGEEQPGWEWKNKEHTRPTRDRENGLWGQEVWYLLCEKGFVQNEGYGVKLTDFERSLKTWLINGYFETENQAVTQAKEWLSQVVKNNKAKHEEE